MNTASPFIRLLDLTIEHFKNVGRGYVDMPQARAKAYFSQKADVVGLYGQNGSGKTSVIQALRCLGELWQGGSAKKYASCIQEGEQEASLACTLAMELGSGQWVVRYSVTLRREGQGCRLSRESMEYAPCKVTDGKYRPGRFTAVARFEENELPKSAEFLPAVTFKEWAARVGELKQNYLSAKVLSYDSVSSYLFAPQAYGILADTLAEHSGKILQAMHHYAIAYMRFICADNDLVISTDLLSINKPDLLQYETFSIAINRPSVMSIEAYEYCRGFIGQLNLVLQTIIPDMTLGIHELGKELRMPRVGSIHPYPAMRFELESVRGDVRVPLKAESDGIKRLLCILGPMVDMYNKPGTLLAIDELDSGIYEYLLGELLAVLAENGKGQLIFTSHNLRPLEMLDKELILFSTTNPENRYIRFSGVRANNNLRDLYIRDINLNSQSEEIYARTDSSRINRAFRRAGKEAL